MDSSLTFSGVWSPLLMLSAAVLLAALGVWHYRALRSRLPPGGALALTALRSASVALVLVLLAGPQLARRTRHHARRPLAVGIDTSRSMGLLGGLESTRLARVRDFLGTPEFQRVADGYLAEYFSFADTVAPVAREGFAGLEPSGARTDLPRAARETGGSAPPPAAVVLFTDGGHGVGRAEALAGLPDTPLVLVGVGAGEIARDAEIVSAEPPAVAFVAQPLQVKVVLRASGLADRTVPLLLKRGDQVLVSRTVQLPPDGRDLEVILEWTPPSPGSYPLAVQLPLQDGEQIADNNRAEIPIEAARDKIRVLLVSGSPSWSYRFLRAALKGDPSLDVVSFIILRSGSDAVDVPQQELSLIPFPTQKIFMEELSNFDLLIFDNFAYQPYLPSQYLDKIQEFVRNGGGFWMLGGPFSYLGGGYQQSPLAGLLPVSLPEAAPPGGQFRDLSLQPRLTAAGRNHPFFGSQAFRNGELPPLRGANVTGPARSGAVVLAEAALPGGGTQPLVVLGRHGRGRVLAVLTDSLWDWSFSEAGRGRGNRTYLTFVRQAVRWSIGDPLLEPLQIELDKVRVAAGDPIRARIRVLGEDFLPAQRPELVLSLRGPGGESSGLAATPEAPGVYRVEVPAPREGSWEIAATASAGGSVYARATAAVSSAWPPEEFRSPGLNREALAALVAGRRGGVLELGDAEQTAAQLEKVLEDLTALSPEERAETRPLGETLPAFLALLALLAAEWVLRRRAGLD